MQITNLALISLGEVTTREDVDWGLSPSPKSSEVLVSWGVLAMTSCHTRFTKSLHI
jgi:hypothetical protein